MASGFQTTHWSLIVKINSNDRLESEEALEALCRNYWIPLYTWLRASGNSGTESEDLVQGFFVYAIRKQVFEKAEAGRGKLRSFLLTCLKRFLADEKERSEAQKRSGDKHLLSLDFIDPAIGEKRILDDLKSGEADPAEIYEYRWARTLLQNALDRLKAEHESKGKEELYRVLVPLLSDCDSGHSYAEAARQLKCSEGTVRVAFHRFKQRFRAMVHEEVAGTLSPGETVEEEMKHLARILDRTSD